MSLIPAAWRLRRGRPALPWPAHGCLETRILDALTRTELLTVAETYELEVEDRRVRDQLVAAAAASRKVDHGAVLGELSRDRLKDLSRELGLDDSGKEKAAIIERIAGIRLRLLGPMLEW